MHHQILRTRGASIAYADHGEGGIAFVFLHYWGGSARTWQGVIEDLSADARCVALDQRGWGGSEAIDGRYDLDAMADDVEDVIRVLGLKCVVLVGHSMGGKVSQLVVARGVAQVAGLMLVAPAPPTPMPVPLETRRSILASYQTKEGVEHAIQILAGRLLSTAERKTIIADTLAGAPRAKEEWTERGMLADISPNLRKFTGPVRIVVGELDQVEQPDVLRAVFADFLPDAIVETIPNVGHLSPIESPGGIASACRMAAAAVRPV